MEVVYIQITIAQKYKIYENIKTINTKILKHLADENISQSNLEQIQAVFINRDIGTDNLLDDINITIDTSNINFKRYYPFKHAI